MRLWFGLVLVLGLLTIPALAKSTCNCKQESQGMSWSNKAYRLQPRSDWGGWRYRIKSSDIKDFLKPPTKRYLVNPCKGRVLTDRDRLLCQYIQEIFIHNVWSRFRAKFPTDEGRN